MFVRPWKVNTGMGTILCEKLYQHASAKFSKQFIKAHWRCLPKFFFVKHNKAGDLIKNSLCVAVSFEKAWRTSLSCTVWAHSQRRTEILTSTSVPRGVRAEGVVLSMARFLAAIEGRAC